MSFKGKRVIVTGAGRGLGAAFAVVLADAGAEVIMTGRNMENLTSLAGSIKLRTGKRPETLHIDLADISQVTLTAKKMRDAGTPLDILINNAAQWLPGAMDSHDAYAIANTITGNVTGTLLFTRGLLPLLEKSGAGDILNIISTSGINQCAAARRFRCLHRLQAWPGRTDRCVAPGIARKACARNRNLSAQHPGHFTPRCRRLERHAARYLMAHQSRHC